VSRGEECRLALHLAGIDFQDVRINSADWPAMK
jgi:glutathione S-transferase